MLLLESALPIEIKLIKNVYYLITGEKNLVRKSIFYSIFLKK